MKKSLLGLVAIPLIITSGLTYADNEHIVYDTANGTITVYTGDFSYGITIQDKNLGASVAGTGPTSYGYYFQRGNNHGNPEGSETVMQLIDWDDSYENHGYDGEVTKFINIHNGNNLLNQNYDYWVETSIGNGDTIYANWTGNNLWGGGNDNDDSDPKIVKGYDTEKHQATNLAGRQGPCESGYHVPSAGERNELVMLWCNVNPDTCDSSAIKTMYNGGTYLMKDGIGTTFSNDLKLPLAGYRIIDLDLSTNNYFDSVQLKEQDGLFMSSSVSDDFLENAFDFYITPEVANPRGALFRVDGESVRCFKNEYIEFPKFTVTFIDDGVEIASGSVISGGTWDETIPTVTKTGYKLDYRHLTGVDEAFDFTSPITGDITLYAKLSINKDIIIQATATESGQTLKINKYFKNAYTVDWGDGSAVQNLTAGIKHTYATSGTYTITLSTTASRWTFGSTNYNPLVPKNGTTMTGVKITYMPSLVAGFGVGATNPGDWFFSCFNYNGALTSLPSGSFDTSIIKSAGIYFFYYFNGYGGELTSLPSGSFNTSNITTVGQTFFGSFNASGKLRSLPFGSFDISKITKSEYCFFCSFNSNGALTSLPIGSFKTSNITTAGSNFFQGFNYKGALTNLPIGSFNTSKITTAGDNFFGNFNSKGSLTSLPIGSFNTSNIKSVNNTFFWNFNESGALKSLPSGSFDTSNITTVGDSFFKSFNENGSLTNLPIGSFNTSNIVTVGGANKDTFFSRFNLNGALSNLPDSFTINSIGVSKPNGYLDAFNSSNYTFNRKVSDLVAGLTPPSNDMNTFSDNQPGRCGVHENWLVNASNACSIIYDANGGTGTITGLYMSNVTEVEVGSGIRLPNKEGYILSGRYDASGNKVDEVIFPDMDGQTLYANWIPIAYKINYELNDGVISGENVTGYTIESEDITLINPTRTGYTFTGRSGTNLDSPTMSVSIPSGSTGDREYEAIWEVKQYTITFKDGENEITTITADYGTAINPPANPTKNGYKFVKWEPEIPATMPAGDMTINAKWECADGYENKGGTCVKKSGGSSGGGGGGGGGGSSSSSCKNLPANAVANNSSKPNSNTNYYYSTNTSKVCTFQCKSGYTRNAEKETCDKVSDTQTTSGKNVKEPEGTGNNTKVETGNNTEIQTGSKIDTSEQTPQDNKQDTQDSITKTPEGKTNSTTSSTYSPEFQEAYEFAKGNGITTMPTIQKANMDGKLTRIAMAKMLSQYAINVLGKTPDTTQSNKFNDVTDKLDSDYDDGVTLAYQLGIMGQNMPGNSFRPNDEVTRAEFATALSRMIYGTSDGVYKSTDKYYTNHMSKLVKEGIITKDDPKMKELRGYVMIMLMRSAK